MLLALLFVAAPTLAMAADEPPPALRCRVWQARGAPPGQLFSLALYDPRTRRREAFLVSVGGGDYEATPERDGYEVRRFTHQVDDDGGEIYGGCRMLSVAACPALMASLRAVSQLEIPPPFVEGMSPRPAPLPSNRAFYSLSGWANYPGGQGGPFRLQSRGSDGAPPSPLEAWSQALVQAFDECADRIVQGSEPRE